eukprot:1151790-Prymnesium_polylepis.2
MHLVRVRAVLEGHGSRWDLRPSRWSPLLHLGCTESDEAVHGAARAEPQCRACQALKRDVQAGWWQASERAWGDGRRAGACGACGVGSPKAAGSPSASFDGSSPPRSALPNLGTGAVRPSPSTYVPCAESRSWTKVAPAAARCGGAKRARGVAGRAGATWGERARAVWRGAAVRSTMGRSRT